MKHLNPLTQEALSVLQAIYDDHLEDRYSFRNEIHRLTASGLSCAFGSLEHFLDRYGYINIDSRHDALHLTTSGLEAMQGDEKKLKSLDDDIQYHFAKEIAEGVLKESQVINAGKRFDQHYIRFEGIGRGGMGSVWRAEHLKTGRASAIKTLEGIDEVVMSGRKSALKKRIERKIRQLAELDHPFICPILDLSVHHTPPYYVMPLYTGGSLRDVLAHGPMLPEVALNLFTQICLGLHHAHERGVLHLDLKPENILLDQRGNIRLFDFGMSRTIAKQVSQAGRQSYIGLGSVAYMAPELLRDPQAEAVSIDIYALGLILYEMLIGELPGRRSPMPSDVIEGLPGPIDDLFDSMTQDAIEQRPQDMLEVLNLLNQVPPFDRLATQKMVMTFIEPSFKLPGLKSLKLPELDEVFEVQASSRERTSSPSSSSTLSTKQANSKPLTSTNRFSTSLHPSPSIPMAIDSDLNPVEELKPSSEPIIETQDQSPQHDHLLEQSMKTESSSAPSPIMNLNPATSHNVDMSALNQQSEGSDQDLHPSEALEEVEMIEEVEVMEEEDMVEDLQSSIFSSSSPKTNQAYLSGTQSKNHVTSELVSSYYHQQSDDDFAEDENTALHDQPLAEEKPHFTQPVNQARHRGHSIAQQLFEKQNKSHLKR